MCWLYKGLLQEFIERKQYQGFQQNLKEEAGLSKETDCFINNMQKNLSSITETKWEK